MSAEDARQDRPRWDDASVGEYALGVMPAAERALFAADLKDDRALRLRLRDWEERLAPLSADVPAVAPPPAVFASIEKRLFPEAAAQLAAPSLAWWRRIGVWQAATALSLALLVALVVVPGLSPSTPPLVAVMANEGASLSIAALYEPASGRLRFNRAAGDAPAAGRSHEVWLIAAGDAPVSLGVLTLAAGELLVPDALRPRMAGGLLAITDEPAGGSPSGKPTGAVLASGPLAAL